jgi:DNA-directed RNA polymerase subunit RPC12/RpoP
MVMMRTAVTRKVMELELVATYHRVVCPKCGGIQGASVVYHGVRKPWRGYVCMFCGEGVDESRWQEVEDGK